MTSFISEEAAAHLDYLRKIGGLWEVHQCMLCGHRSGPDNKQHDCKPTEAGLKMYNEVLAEEAQKVVTEVVPSEGS